MNVCFVEAALEMGKSEPEIIEALCEANNDIMVAFEKLKLTKHEYIEYYIEELTKEVFIIRTNSYRKKRITTSSLI